jgi:hypothetical protein
VKSVQTEGRHEVMIRAHFPLGQENKNALSVDLTKKVLVFMKYNALLIVYLFFTRS